MKTALLLLLLAAPFARAAEPASRNAETSAALQDERAQTGRIAADEKAALASVAADKSMSAEDRKAATKKIKKDALARRNAIRLKIRTELRAKQLKLQKNGR